jgi:golgi apparatus protein 1
MQCLQENLMQPDFGQECLAQVGMREAAMQSDWHEDYGIASSCGEDIDMLCKDAQVWSFVLCWPTSIS